MRIGLRGNYGLRPYSFFQLQLRSENPVPCYRDTCLRSDALVSCVSVVVDFNY